MATNATTTVVTTMLEQCSFSVHPCSTKKRWRFNATLQLTKKRWRFAATVSPLDQQSPHPLRTGYQL
jgi:hypothetical protein